MAFHSWINQCFLPNRLSKWFNDSFICLLSDWISVFVQIDSLNDSIIHSKTCNLLPPAGVTVQPAERIVQKSVWNAWNKEKQSDSQTLSASNTIWDISSRDLTSAIPIKKECIFFGPRSAGWNSMLQVKCLDHIISEEERTSVADEKQVRKDKLCSLRASWAFLCLWDTVEWCFGGLW